MSENESRPVVVGVDGSAAAQAALQWAVEDARRRGCAVEAVSAWHPDYGALIGPVPAEIWREITPEALKSARRVVLDEAVAAVTGAGDVEVRKVLVEGDARDVLTKAAQGAALLVVGSRGHGTFVGAVLGSVSNYCVHHSPCPVVVVRDDRVEREARAAKAVEAAQTALPLTPGPLL